MKNKIIKLVEQGISVQTLSKMNESQVNALYKRILFERKEENKEQTKKTTTTTQYDISKPEQKKSLEDMMGKKGIPTVIDPSRNMVSITSGKEKELGEAKKKKTKGKNPWAICTATMGKEFGTSERSDWSKSQMKKYEKCVMGVKKSLKEGIDPYEYILEEKIMDILETSLNPKMTKRDFLNNVYSKSVMEAEEAPVKAPPKPKTPTKPGEPDTPFKPKHKPKPKAGKSDIPSWFTWDKLGINLK